MNILITVASGWAMVAGVFFLLWLLSVRQRNAGWVDVGWSLTLVLLAAWYALQVDGIVWRRVLFAALAAAWGLRLGWHILRRLLREGGEDPRYAHLRAHWGQHANARFFWFFQAQGLANLLLTAPVLLLMRLDRAAITLFDLLGAALMIAAVAGETMADRQLARWRADPANRGRTCREGLWAASRHPNYFFEWLHWTAYPVFGLALFTAGQGAWWPLTLLGPAVMLVLLLRFTGIPYTERQALKSRGEDYRRYQREVPAFFPRIQNLFKS
jgi:steroid 5-alpha reductase family enzyme